MRLATFLLSLTIAGLARIALADSATVVEKEQTVQVGDTAATIWSDATVGQPLAVHQHLRTGALSRAAVRLSDLSVFRVNELTTIEILPPQQTSDKPGIDLKSGALYFFSREKAQEQEIQTPVATGALQGTEFYLSVAADGHTKLAVLDGKVELKNSFGRVSLASGEEGDVQPGHAPTKTAMIEAVNIIQWCLYYPGVVDPAELRFPPVDQAALAPSLNAYRQGDLLNALKLYPAGLISSHPSSQADRIYHAAVLLSVGQVDKARAELAAIPPAAPGRQALDHMIAAVKFQPYTPAHPPGSAGEFIAQSYYQQSRGDLVDALKSAQAATAIDPQFGYAWARLAELQFSFGHTREAERALEVGLRLAPRNAQAATLQGFLFSADNKILKAKAAFDSAIALDGALANAWLGRGLCDIRQGNPASGDERLQVAATLEPNRSILRSYLGKAFGNAGNDKKARLEFSRAEAIDPHDPTPWLYSALQNKMDNQINQAVTDIEHSLALNDNRGVYRSQFLLDQDRAVRSANLAAIYQADGMDEVAVREASQAVEDDYTNASAHLFLANAYNDLRDPTRIILRYETPWYNELLLAFLLSPVGGGPLSEYVSEQEYSKLFEANRIGLSTATDYLTNGIVNEIASQYGTFDNFSYSLDTQYLYQHGIRPNDQLSLSESAAQFKLQLGPDDTVLARAEFVDNRSGDDELHFYNQQYNPGGDTFSPDLHFTETQSPGIALLGWHHDWSPGVQTLLLLARLEDHIGENQTRSDLILDPTSIGTELFLNDFGLNYESDFTIYSAELQQIFEQTGNTFLVGARYQSGEFNTSDVLNAIPPLAVFTTPAANQDFAQPFERISVYAYDFLKPARWLSLTLGATYDYMKYPLDYRSVPLSDSDTSIYKFSPKAGISLTPFLGALIRGAYTKSLGGTSFDGSTLLEPTVIDGFPQVYRSLIPEDNIGELSAPRYENEGITFQQKLASKTYFGVDLTKSSEELSQDQGLFAVNPALEAVPGSPFILPSGTYEHLSYRESTILTNLNQLIGDDWSLGARWRLSNATLHDNIPALPAADAITPKSALLDQVQLFVLYNHPSGFFAQVQAVYTNQQNQGYIGAENVSLEPPSDFWQFNLFAGYRFRNNFGEISLGLLDINGRDYRLNSLNELYTPIDFYDTIATERTLLVRVRFNF